MSAGGGGELLSVVSLKRECHAAGVEKLEAELRSMVIISIDELQDFESSHLTLDSVEEAIVDFCTQASLYTNRNVHTIVRRIDNKTNEQIFSFQFEERIPGKLRVLATRIVSDVKHSLDQALCDAAVALGRPNGSGLHFPIGNSLISFEGEIKRRCKGVQIELIEYIRSVKPYGGGNTALYCFLAMAGRGKHQRILQVSLVNTGMTLGMGADSTIIIPAGRMGLLGWNDLRNQFEFLRIPINTVYKGNFCPVIELEHVRV